MPNNICLRGCNSSPIFNREMSQGVCPLKERFQSLQQTPLFSAVLPANINKEVALLDEKFQWQAAQMQALFNTLYLKGIISEEDQAKIQQISMELEDEYRQLQLLNLPVSAAWQEAISLIEETKALFSALKEYDALLSPFESAYEKLINRTHDPIFPGESLSAGKDLEQAFLAIMAIDDFIDHVPGSSQRERLDQFLQDEFAKLTWAVEDWVEQVSEDLKHELRAAKENEAAGLLTEALAGQVRELGKELQGLVELASESALLKPLQTHFTWLLKNLEGKTSDQASPVKLKWGSSEWFELRRQSKEPSSSHSLSWLNPENWSGKSKQVVHALLTALQLTPHRNSPLVESLMRTAENAPDRTVASIVQESRALQHALKQGGHVPASLENTYQLAAGLPSHEAEMLIVQHALYRMLKESEGITQTFAEFRQQQKDDPVSGNSVSLPAEQTIAGLHSIRQACNLLANCEQKMAQLPASQVLELKRYIDLLYHGLMESVAALPPKTCSLPKLASWRQVVEDQCFGVKTLEKKIAELMPAVRAKVDEADLDEYGPKHKNLVKQARLAEVLQLSGLKFILPKGIKNKAMRAFLQREAPDVFFYWQELGSRFKDYQGKDFLGEPEIQHILSQIDESLKRTFEAAGKDPVLFNQLVPPEMQTWLENLHHQGEYLMVRSTGAEDEKEEKQKENSKERKIPNAGGNASPAYITPAPAPFCRAAGEVIRSYFSIPSLKNRIEAGNNPFEQPLKLAVTSQQLIGEPPGGALHSSLIPISLVLFSSEPLYAGEEKFRAMRLSATYGHGEGVVGNQGVNSDTALLLISETEPDKLYILYDNVEKPVRLGPVETASGIELLPIENPKTLQRRPVLSQEFLVRLYQWGVIGEKFFDDHPTDMELVIKGNTIYPVQARAINRPKLHTTFIDRKKIAEERQPPITAELQTKTLVAGTASALILHSPYEILYAATLKQAQDEYKADKHRLVVVSAKEPQNSHPIVNFSSLGVPCMYTSDPKTVLQMRETVSKEPLVVCVQSGWFGKWDASIADPESFVKEGLTVHPAQVAISLPAALSPSAAFEDLPEDVSKLLTALRNAWGTDALEILQQFKQNPWVHSLRDSRLQLERQIKASGLVPKEAKRALRVLIELETALNKSFAELEASLEKAQPNERLKPLFHLKVLETLLAGKAIGPGQFSLLSAAALYREAVQAIAYQNRLSHKAYLVDLLPAGKQTFEPQFAEKWRIFLLKLENLVESGAVGQNKIKEFKRALSQLEQFYALPAALTFFIQPLEPAEDCLERCLQLLSNEQGTFSEFAKLANARTRLEGHLYRFGKKQTLEKALSEFKQLASDWDSSWLADKFQQSTPAARMVLLRGMFELIAAMDTAIKTMKASPELTRTEKGIYFKEMVGIFFSLYEDWASFLSLYQSSDPEQLKAAQEYVAKLKAVFEAMLATEENLDASPGFYVTSSLFTPREAGNEQPYVLSLLPNFNGNTPPESVEDVFTLVHQNLLKMLAFEGQKIYTKETIANAALPPLVAQILFSKEIKGDQIGVLVTENELEVAYNVPLRVHSAQIVFNYNKQTQELVFTSKFLGWDANSRWSTMHRLAQFADALGLLELAQPIMKKEREIVISWKIKTPEDLKGALREFEEFCDITFHDRKSAYFKDRLPGFIDRWGLLSKELPLTAAERMFDIPLSKEMAIEVASKYAEKGLHWEFNINAVRRLCGQVKEGISDKGVEDGLKLAHLVADQGLADFELLELALLLQEADLNSQAEKSVELLFKKIFKAILSNKETEARLLSYDTPFAARLFARLAFEEPFKEQALAFAEQHVNHPETALRLTALQIVTRHLPSSENILHKLSLNESPLKPVLRQQCYALMTQMLACNMPIDRVYASLFQKIIPYSKEEYQTILQLHLQMMEKTKQGLHEALNFADRAFLEAPRENKEWLETYYFTLLEKTSDPQPFLERVRNRSLPSKFRAILANHLAADLSIVKEVADLIISGVMTNNYEILEHSLSLIDKYLITSEIQKHLLDLVQFGDLKLIFEDSTYILKHVRSGLSIKLNAHTSMSKDVEIFLKKSCI